jgi:hypothetical protein
MKKILRMLGLAMVLSALLVVSITGAVFAAGPSDNAAQTQTQTQTQNQGEECICGECPCEECPIGDCNQNQIGDGYKYRYANVGVPEDGGHKYAHKNGKTVE